MPRFVANPHGMDPFVSFFGSASTPNNVSYGAESSTDRIGVVSVLGEDSSMLDRGRRDRMDRVDTTDTVQGTNTSVCCKRMRPPQSLVPLPLQRPVPPMHLSIRRLLTLKPRRRQLRVVHLRR